MRFLMTAACLMATTATVMAEPLKPETVPRNAKWVIHLDQDALAETELMQRVRQRREDVVQQIRQWMQEQYGINPQEDLHGLTMFSESFESHTGAAVLAADFNAQKVQAELESRKGVQKDQMEGMVMYTWDIKENALAAVRQRRGELRNEPQQNQQQNRPEQNEGGLGAETPRAPSDHDRDYEDKRMVTAVLVDDKHMVFAPSRETAHSVAMLLKGEAPSLEGQDSKLIAEAPEGTFLYGSAIQLSEITQNQSAFPVLRQHEHVMIAFGEREGKLFDHTVLHAKDEEVAKGMESGLKGVNSLIQIAVSDSERLAKLVADNASITREGTKVTVDWQGDLDTVVDALDDLKSRIQEQMQNRNRNRGADRNPNQDQNPNANLNQNRNPNQNPNQNPNPNQR